jgi:L-threonylcarbamoyladenylate synthase
MIGGDIQAAKRALEDGLLVAIPTETVYGLAANATDPDAVLKIFEAKNRPHFDPLIVHIGSELLEWFIDYIPVEAIGIVNKYWPGPLTILIPRPPFIPPIVTSGLPLVGLRMPNHIVTLKLLSTLDFPLAAPSANPFGYVSPTSAQHVADQLLGKVDYILDGGPSTIGVESSIVSFEDPEHPVLLRLGGLGVEELRKEIPHLKIDIASHSNPKAPGQLDQHYSTHKPIYFGENIQEIIDVLPFTTDEIFVLGFDNNMERIYPHSINLARGGDLKHAARALFAALRIAEWSPTKCIVAAKIPDIGLGMAINDRLRRASSPLP